MRKDLSILYIVLLTILNYSCKTGNAGLLKMDNTYPWCIVAYDSMERNPSERLAMLKKMNFSKYAYDWRDMHLETTAEELSLANENDIEIISVWLWLNAKRDSSENLSSANEELFRIIDSMNLKTTFWLSFSNNYFQDLEQEKSMEKAIELVDFICAKAANLDCKVALYNHKGWFGSPYNQIEIIKALPQWNLKMVYNFHHAHDYINDFTKIARLIQPYLTAVNLNGMEKDGAKIHPLGEGNHERDMIGILINEGFYGPWGLLGHVENEDVQIVLERNLQGLEKLLEHH